MEVPNLVVIRLIYLSDTFCFNCLAHCLSINFRVKREFDGVNDVTIKRFQANTLAILLNGVFYVIKYVFV